MTPSSSEAAHMGSGLPARPDDGPRKAPGLEACERHAG